MFHSPTRTTLALFTALVLPLAATACGGSDGADTADGEAASAAGDGGSPDVAAVTTCLENRGFEVTREADQDEAFVLPDDYKESVGLIENITLGSIGDVRGTGNIGFYTDDDSAAEADEAAAGFRTEDVMASVTGAASWDYIVTAGDDPGVTPMIEACLA